MAAPTELVIQIPIATVRCWSSSNMLRISDSVDGASVAAIPSRAREAISISGLDENAATTDAPRTRRADQEQSAAADPVAQRAHRDQKAGDEEAVDVHDPEQLGAARAQVGAEQGTASVRTVRSIA